MKIKFSLLIVVLASALAFIGYYGQDTLSQLISSIKEESSPNYRLSLLQEISSSLLVGENSINRFNITKIPNDLDNYYKTVTTIDAKLDSFTSLSVKNYHLKEAIELNRLIEQKLVISSQLIELKDKENTTIAFNRILHAIRKQEEALTDSLSRITIQPEPDTSSMIVADPDISFQPDISSTEKPPRENIFKKIFGRKKRDEDIVLPVEPEFDQSIPADSIESPIVTSNTVDSNYSDLVRKIITQISNEEREINRKLSKQELALLVRDNEISDQLNELIETISKGEQIVSDRRAAAATGLTAKTQYIISITIVCALILIFLLLGIIFFDLSRLKKNRKELKEAKEKAEKLALAKQEFLATMTHEIRTPLTSIIGFTDQLDGESSIKKRTQFIEIIRKSSSHLLTIVNDILDFAKLESNTITPEPINFNVKKEISEVVGLFEAQSASNDLTITVESSLTNEIFRGDAFRYKQIVINLMGNALKFTNQGSVAIKLQLTTAQGTEALSTIIEDTGIGIPPDRLAHIFDKFEQADNSTTRHFGGTGLGLSIVKKLVNLLGGTIAVNSEVGVGTRFEVIIPFEEGSLEESTPYTQSTVTGQIDLSGKRVLVVDDEQYNLELNKVILERLNIDVTLLDSGANALELIKKTPFDLAILDIQMPGLSGLEIAERVRGLEHPLDSLPLIASTAATLNDNIESIKNAGFNRWIAKPFSQEDLIKIITESLAANESVESSTEQLDSLSIDALLEISQGNVNFVLNMLKLYLTSTEDNIAQLQEAMAAEERENVERIAHKMVSPTRHLNLTYFTNSLKRIELYAQEGKEFSQIVLQFEKATKMWQRIAPLIKMKMEELENSAVSI